MGKRWDNIKFETHWFFNKTKTGQAIKNSGPVKGTVEGLTEGGKALIGAGKEGGGVVNSVMYHGTKAAARPFNKAFKVGKFAVLGAAAVGGLALLANMGRKPVQAATDNLDLTTDMNLPEVPAAPVLQPLDFSPQPSTLMGQLPIEGEHVAKLGRSGQSQGFSAQRAPQIAEDLRAKNVSSGEIALGA